MGKQQKSKQPKVKKTSKSRVEREVLKKPKGMCKVLFKELAWLLALELKEKSKPKEDRRKD